MIDLSKVEQLQGEEVQPVKITLEQFAKELGIRLVVGSPKQEMSLSSISVNRPGLFFAGFSDYFAQSRVQVLGNAEMYYLRNMDNKSKSKMLDDFFDTKIPCIIIARDLSHEKLIFEKARDANVPVFLTDKVTTQIINTLTTFLNKFLAPTDLINGELVEISGIGVLIIGDSGLGKSETVLDLITRGHRLVADDVVLVKNVKGEIIGQAPERTRFYMEVRGIGIIDVRSLYGVSAVLYDKKIDLIVELKQWGKDTEVERLGNVEKYHSIMGVDLPKIELPVAAGRNLSIIVEVAARNHRLKALGYNSIEEFMKKYR